MIIRSVKLKNFRNFSEKRVNFCDSVNVIFGFNGQGKTNILEALSVACLSKSFRTKNDGDLVKFGEDNYQIVIDVVLDNEIEKEIKVDYSVINHKNIEIDHTKIKSVLEIFGAFPVVILSPEDDSISNGPPQERRKFINFVLSQLDREYLRNYQDFNRTIKQRNKILQDAKESRYKFSEKIEPWNEKLYQLAKTITENRKEFLESLHEKAYPIHQELTIYSEKFSFDYKPSFQTDWQNKDRFFRYLEEHKNEEILKGTTLVGPHRDEIRFLLDGHDIRKYGSRGQHRTLLLSLKIAVYNLILQKLKEAPVFLMDDVYSEIDDVREQAFNDYFMTLKQVFITTHEKELKFNLPEKFDLEIKYIYIENNKLETAEDTLFRNEK